MMAVGSCEDVLIAVLLLLIPYAWKELHRCCFKRRSRIPIDNIEKTPTKKKTNGSSTSPENGNYREVLFDIDSSLEKSIQTFSTDSITTHEDEAEDDDEDTARRRTNTGYHSPSKQTCHVVRREFPRKPLSGSIPESFYDEVSDEFNDSSQDDTNVSMDLNELIISSNDQSLKANASPQLYIKARSRKECFLSRSDSHLTISLSDHSAANFCNVSKQLRRKLCPKKPTTLLESDSLPRLSHSSSRLNFSSASKSPKPSILDARSNYLKDQLQQRGIKLSSPSLRRDHTRLKRRLSNLQM